MATTTTGIALRLPPVPMLTLFVLGLMVLLGQESRAQSPGVPVLPTTNADYVGYAVTNLPAYFGPGTDVGNANNTPAGNPITDAGATLGRVLFYDQRLSHNDSTSCASCHHQENGFSDPDQFSEGFEGGLTGRHSMGLSNAAFYLNQSGEGRFFWDERAATLEDQVLGPIQDSVEMGTNLDQLREELAATDFYPTLFSQAYSGSTEITDDKIANALAQFVYQSKYDEARAGGAVGSTAYENVLTTQEVQGSDLFHGAGRCSTCHKSDAQIADRPHNIGLDATNTDLGAGNGTFKVPSLRNISIREGYMHDGRFATLEEVIDFYSTGIQDNPNLAPGLRNRQTGNPVQFNFTQNEKDALIAFLGTLTDDTFLTSELFSDPFQELLGDFDGNGLVEAADLEFWQADTTASGGSFLDWQRGYGQSWQDLTPSVNAVSAASAIPEPATLWLVVTATLITSVLISGRRRPAISNI